VELERETAGEGGDGSTFPFKEPAARGTLPRLGVWAQAAVAALVAHDGEEGGGDDKQAPLVSGRKEKEALAVFQLELGWARKEMRREGKERGGGRGGRRDRNGPAGRIKSGGRGKGISFFFLQTDLNHFQKVFKPFSIWIKTTYHRK
jgi:hypothetical protein